jgi:hypothetical protein
VVSEGRGGSSARIAASALGVAVSWVEQRPFANRDFAGSGSESHFYGRLIDPRTLAPRGAATELFSQSAPYELGMGPALIAFADGSLSAAVCTCVGGSARTECSLTNLAGAGTSDALRPTPRQASTCPQGLLAATAVGAQALVGSPFPDAAGLRMYGTAVRALQDVELDGVIDAPTMAAVGSDQAVYVRRTPTAIELRLFDVRGNARGRAVTLSTPGQQLGAPFALSIAGATPSVMVAFAQRRGRAPWRVHLATWRPGAAVIHQDILTGSAPAMAPSLAPAAGGCVALSWTEGTGRTTVARVGRVCNGALDANSVAQLSRFGVEAGDSELASDGGQLFAVWQEIPSTRGSRAELHVARLGCR